MSDLNPTKDVCHICHKLKSIYQETTSNFQLGTNDECQCNVDDVVYTDSRNKKNATSSTYNIILL